MKKYKYPTPIIFSAFVILVAIGKILRYTLMKNSLVANGIGQQWISIINSNLSINEILKLTIAGEQNGTAIIIYKVLNIFHLTTYIDFEIAISLIFNLIIISMFFKFNKNLDIMQFIFLSVSIIVLNLFDFCLSKDPIQMIYFLLIYYMLISDKIKHKKLVLILILTISAITFRFYYILIVFFVLECDLIFEKIFKNDVDFKKILVSLCIFAGTYMLMLLICKYFKQDYYLELIRVRTRTSTASTDIRNWIQGSENIILYGINYLITVIRLIFPIELLMGGIQYLLYFVYQLVITSTFIKNLKNIKNSSNIEKISMFIYLGFVLTSATFEPDFGSWIRHEAILFPIFIITNKIIKNKYLIDSFEENKN